MGMGKGPAKGPTGGDSALAPDTQEGSGDLRDEGGFTFSEAPFEGTLHEGLKGASPSEGFKGASPSEEGLEGGLKGFKGA